MDAAGSNSSRDAASDGPGRHGGHGASAVASASAKRATKVNPQTLVMLFAVFVVALVVAGVTFVQMTDSSRLEARPTPIERLERQQRSDAVAAAEAESRRHADANHPAAAAPLDTGADGSATHRAALAGVDTNAVATADTTESGSKAGGFAGGSDVGGGTGGGWRGLVAEGSGRSVDDSDGECIAHCPPWLKQAYPTPPKKALHRLFDYLMRQAEPVCFDGIPMSAFTSAEGEDMYILYTFFQAELFSAVHGGRASVDKPRLTYMEAGAFDGLTQSNTWLMNKVFGWYGLNVEPSPPNFELLVKRRPNAYNVPMGVCPKPGTMKIYGEGLNADANKLHLQGWEHDQHGHGKERNVYTVPCMPLSRMVKEGKITHFDYMSVDVEGGELGMLQTLDWDATPVYVLMAEQNKGRGYGVKPCVEDPLRAYLHERGMCMFADGVGHSNEVWVNRTEFARVRRPPPPKPDAGELSEKDLAAAAATYEVDVKVADEAAAEGRSNEDVAKFLKFLGPCPNEFRHGDKIDGNAQWLADRRGVQLSAA